MYDHAVPHDDHFVADLFDVAEKMRAHEHVHALLFFHFADQAQHAPAGGRVQSVGRLVKDNQFRAVNDGLGQLGHLLHSQRIGSQFAIARFTKTHVKQRLVRLFKGNRLRQAGQLGHQAQE